MRMSARTTHARAHTRCMMYGLLSTRSLWMTCQDRSLDTRQKDRDTTPKCESMRPRGCFEWFGAPTRHARRRSSSQEGG